MQLVGRHQPRGTSSTTYQGWVRELGQGREPDLVLEKVLAVEYQNKEKRSGDGTEDEQILISPTGCKQSEAQLFPNTSASRCPHPIPGV